MTILLAPGLIRPGVFRFLLISLLALQLRGAEPEPFQLELLATQFGRFHLEDPERQSWSRVEDGAKITYRGMSWSAQQLRFHTKQVSGLDAPLIDQFEARGGSAPEDLSVEVDTRSYAAKGFPLRCLVQAAGLELELKEETEQALFFQCRLEQVERCAGRLLNNGAWLDCAFTAQELVLDCRCLKLGNGRMAEPEILRLHLRGQIVAAFDAVQEQRHMRIRAEALELQFQQDGDSGLWQLASGQVTGSSTAAGLPSQQAQIDYYADKQRRSYAARKMQLVLGTGARLKNFSCSSDVVLSNQSWSGTIKACVVPSGE